MNQLIRCVNCDEVILKTPFDQLPEYEQGADRSSDLLRAIERDDFQDFLFHHHGHRLENLKIIEDSFVSEKAYIEPVKTSYFKATNGKEKFVIKKFREKIDEPLRYQLISGDYSLECSGLQVQSEEIAKQLKTEVKSPPLSQAQISAFLKLYEHVSETVDTKNLERVSEESTHPLEIYYKMDDVMLFYLLRNCRSIFKGQEYLNIEEFIHRHKENGVLLLKARYKIRITEKARAKKKAPLSLVPIEAEKIAEKKIP